MTSTPDTEDVSRLAITVGRAGIAAQGVLYLVIAWLAAQIALSGGSGEEASSSGALSQLAEQPFGMVLLVVLAIGFVAYIAWQGFEAAGKGLSPAEPKDRAKAIGKAIVGIVLLVSTISVLAGGGSGGGGGGTEQEATRTVLTWPAGRLLVALAGLAVIGFAGYLAYRGVKGKIREKLEPGVSQWIVRLGQVGDVARGVAFAAIGVLLLVAAWQADSSEAGGLDSGLQSLRSQPFGAVIVLAVALGLAAWGAFCVLAARKHRKG